MKIRLIVSVLIIVILSLCLFPIIKTQAAECQSSIGDNFSNLDKWFITNEGDKPWSWIDNQENWSVSAPIDSIDASAEYFDGNFIRAKVYRNDRVWTYYCLNTGDCQAQTTLSLAELWSSIGQQQNWTTPPPTDSIDAQAEFFNNGVLKAYVFKGDRVWYYSCSGTPFSCSAGYDKTIGDFLSSVAGWQDPLPPTGNLDAVSLFSRLNNEENITTSYLYQNNLRWHYDCDSSACQAQATKDIAEGDNKVIVGEYFGKQAVKIEKNDPLNYILMDYVLCNSSFGRIAIDFYDDYDENITETLDKGVLFSISNTSDTQIVGVGLLTSFDGSYIYRVHKNYSPLNSTLTTGIKRSKGWHRFELVTTPVGAFGLIDGVNLTWLNGKKTSEGFTYDINTDTDFLNNGFQKISIISSWGLKGNSYFSNLRFSSLPDFNYTNSKKSMAKLSLEIANYFLNQYPYSVNLSFYDTLSEGDKHLTAQEYNQILNMAGILTANYKVTGEAVYLDHAKSLFSKVNNDYQLWKNCVTTPYTFHSFILTSRLLWESLDEQTKQLAVDNIIREADFWLNVNLNDENLDPCTNPWHSTRDHLPFQRPISDTNVSLMNSATRDNAWTSAFFRLAGTFKPIVNNYPQKAADYLTMAEIIAYHSLTVSGDGSFGIHPFYPEEGIIAVSPTLLDNFNNPTVWSNPNPFYTFTTPQQIIRGLWPDLINYKTDFSPNFFHHWSEAIGRAETFIDFETFRSKSSVETGIAYAPTSDTFNTSFDLAGKGHQNEDFCLQAGVLAGFSILPSDLTGLDSLDYQNKLFKLLKYEFYTLGEMPRMPWYPDGRIDNLLAVETQQAVNDGWGTWRPEKGTVDATSHLNFIVNGVVAFEHVYSALYLDPDIFQLRGDLNSDSLVNFKDLKTGLVIWKKQLDASEEDLIIDRVINLLDIGEIIRMVESR